MTSTIILVTLSSFIGISLAQRPGYAGSRPYGYPVIISTTPSTTMAAAGTSLGDRFGEVTTSTTQLPPRLPIEANGNQQLVDYYSKLPKDQQPFWLLNWQALEENRRQPQTYPVRDNMFLDFSRPGFGQQGSGSTQSGIGSGTNQQGSGTGFGQQGSGSGFRQQGTGTGLGQQGSGSGLNQPRTGTGLGQQGSGSGFNQQGTGTGFGQQGSGSGFNQQGTGTGFGQQGSGPGFNQPGAGTGLGQQGSGSGFNQPRTGTGFDQQGTGLGFDQQAPGTRFGRPESGSESSQEKVVPEFSNRNMYLS